MNTPKDTDQFLVDAEHGIHYHAAGCLATTYSPLAKYVKLSYGEIRAIRTHKGELFIAHDCVRQMRATSKPEIDRWAKQLSERKTVLKIACSYCKRDMGEKDGQGVSGTSHSTCPACWQKVMPGEPYPAEDQGKELPCC